jgi:hypothetical protein
MTAKYRISILFVVFFMAISYSQNTNAEKILGCWVLKKMVYTDSIANSPTLSEEAINSYVCFENNGRFITRIGGQESKVVNGTYHISTDGTTLFQSSSIDLEDTAEQAEIALLTDKILELKVEFGIMSFERK